MLLDTLAPANPQTRVWDLGFGIWDLVEGRARAELPVPNSSEKSIDKCSLPNTRFTGNKNKLALTAQSAI
jgi:hypothetical protein